MKGSNRRRFLQAIGATAAGALVLPAVVQAARPAVAGRAPMRIQSPELDMILGGFAGELEAVSTHDPSASVPPLQGHSQALEDQLNAEFPA